MPIYSLQAPDGKTYKLEAPEGATEDRLYATLFHLAPEAANPPKKTSAGFNVGDLARSAGSSFTGGLQALTGIAGANNPVSAYLGDVSKGLQEGLTPERKAEIQARQEKIAAAEKTGSVLEQVKAGLGSVKDAPLQSLVSVASSSVTPLALGAAAVALAPQALVSYLGANILARVAYGTIGAGMGAGQNKQETFDRIKKEYMDANVPEAEAEKKAMLAQNWLGKNKDQIAINAAAGAFEAATGAGRIFAPGKAAKAATKAPSLTKTVGTVGLEEAVPETLQSLASTAATNIAATREGFAAPTFKGAAAPAAESALSAFMFGAATGPKDYLNKRGEFEAQQRPDVKAPLPEQPPPPDTSSSDYAKNIATQYQAAEGRKNELLAQLRDIQKNSATETADRLHNTQIEQQVQAMTPELEQLATEYNKVLPNLPEPAKVEPAVVEGADIEDVAVEQAKKPTMTVGDALDDPVGRFSKDELISRSPKIAQYVDSVRKKQGKPEIDSYSIEDIRNAMPNQLPDAEKADLNSLIAAKTGYVGGMKYVPEDVIKVAKQKNIDTTTTGFKYFLQRATGENEIASMSQPQLHSAFKALAELPRFEEVQILPEMTNATIYNPEQYTSAVTALQGLVTKRNEAITQEQAKLKEGQQPKLKPVSVDEAQSLIKRTAKLKSEDDIRILFQDANRKGDIDLTSEGNVTLQAKGPQAEFNIKEGAAPAEKTGFNVMRGDKRLYFTENEEDAGAKAVSLGKSVTPAVAQIEKAIAKENSSIAAGQRTLSAMESNGLFNTPQYQQASARQDSVVANASQNIKRLNEQRDMLQQPVVVNPTGRVGNKRVFTVNEPGVSQRSFDTREEAEKHVLENLPAKRLNELAVQTKAPGFANRLKKEQERRKNPPKPFLAEKPEVKKEPEVKQEPKVNPKAEELQGQLLPMLRKFGLGDVALKIEEGMKDEGSYVASTIKIALDANNPVRVLRHESIHGLKDLGFFTPGQWKVLENQADKVWINKYLKQRNIDGQPLQSGQQSRFDAYQNLYANDSAAVREEAIADAFADFDVNGAPKGLFSTLLDAMRKFFRNLRSAFTGAGYETADDVFGKVERGELKATKAKEQPAKASVRELSAKDRNEVESPEDLQEKSRNRMLLESHAKSLAEYNKLTPQLQKKLDAYRFAERRAESTMTKYGNQMDRSQSQSAITRAWNAFNTAFKDTYGRSMTDEENFAHRSDFQRSIDEYLGKEVPTKRSLRNDRSYGKFGPNEETISTRKPTSAKPLENHLTDKLNVGIGVVKEDPKLMAKHAQLVKDDPLMGNFKSDSDEATINHFIDALKDNLLYLWKATPKKIRDRSTNWYKGANRIANNLADGAGISERASSGVLAALSPQTPWDVNVSQAARVITIWKDQQNTVTDQSMTDWFDSKINELKKKDISPDVMTRTRDSIAGKSFKELEGTGLQPWWLRAYDETHHSREYHLVAPEGESAGLMKKKDGSPANMPWGNTGNIEKALSILNNDSMENISEQMGDAHKVRSFYNNIVYPDSPDEHVTIDTHAVAAARFEPLSGNAPEVLQAWGGQGSSSLHGQSGLYGEYAEAYRRAAKELGVLPREVQSVTWEKVRGLFPDTFKTEKAVSNVKSIWKQFKSGQITIDEVRKQITESSPNQDPNWSGVPTQSAEDAGVAPNEIEPASGTVRGTGTAEGAKPSLRTSTPEFKKWFGDSKVVDADGNPLVVYHGTPYDFVSGKSPATFNTKDFGALLGKGAYFTADPIDAEQYAGKAAYGGKPNIIPAYVSLKNPYITESVVEKIPKQDELSANGYDGVLLKNQDGSVKWAVAFEPTQIKSAIGNIGAFDETNPDIRKSLREFRKNDLPKNKQTYTIPADTTLFHGSHKTQAEQIEAMGRVLRSRSEVKASGGYTNEGGLIFFGEKKTAEDWAKNRGDPMSVEYDKDAGVIRDTGTVFQTITDKPYRLIKRRYELSASEAAKVTEALGLPEYKSLSAGDTASLAADRGDSFSNSKAPRYEVTKAGGKQTMSAPWPIIFDALGVDGYFDDFGVAISAKNGIRLEGKEGKMERFSLRTNVKDDLSNMPNGAAITAIMNRVTPKRQEEGFIERLVGSFAPESFSYLRQKALDRYNRLNDYDKMVAKQMGGIQLLAEQSAHWAALSSDLAAGVTASALGVGNRMGGIPVLKNGYTTVSDENGTIKGAVEIFSPLAQRGDPDIYRLYQTWSAAKRGTRLLREGRMEFLSPAEVKDALTLSQKYPEFKSVQEEWIKFNNGLVKYQVDTGVLSESAGAEFMKYSDYIPFYRQMDGEATVGPSIYQSISGVKAPKKLTGKGQAPLSDFLETVVRNTQAAIQAGMKNVAAQRAVQNAEKIGMAQRLNYSATAPNTITVLEKGLKVSYESADPLFIDAVSSLNLPELPFLSIISKPADLLRTMVTLDPGFMLANMMRDSVSAYVTSGAKMTPIASTIKNFGSVLMKNSPEYQKLLSAGVIGGYEFSRNIEASAEAFSQDLREKTGTRTGLEKALRPLTGLKGFLERGTEASDAATRIEVYKATLKETGNEAEAIRRALEVMNFNRKGSSAVVRIAAAGIPFLNARMQGLDVFFRAGIRPFSFLDQNATEQEKQIQKAMFIRGATIMALSVMYAAAVSGDPDYEGQEAETKDNNWIIPSLGIKVPIPFEVGTLFKTIPERIYRYAYGSDNTKDLADSMKRALLSTFAFNPIFQVVNPILEVRDNYSSFTQRPIIGEAMKGIAPEYQVGPGTTKMAELLGKEIGMSPIQIDHLYKGYTGTMGMYLADVMDSVYSLGDDNPKASKRFEQTPVLKRFLVDPEARGTVSAYYDLKTSVDQVVRTVNRLTKEGNEEVGPYLEKNASLYAARGFISDLDKQMQELQSHANMIRNSPMDRDAKRDALSEITKAQNELTKNIQDVRKAVQP
jgi:hypothetical protein